MELLKFGAFPLWVNLSVFAGATAPSSAWGWTRCW